MSGTDFLLRKGGSMSSNRTVRQRIALGLLWVGSSIGAMGGVAYPAASIWLERNTIQVLVVDSDDQPVANAAVSKMPLGDFMR